MWHRQGVEISRLISYALVVLLVSVALVGRAPIPARGKSMPASVDTPTFKTFDGTNTRPTTIEDRDFLDTYVLRLTEAANSLFSSTPGWECLKADKLVSPWRVEVSSTIWTQDPRMGNRWSVALSVWVKKTMADTSPIDITRIRRYPPPQGSLILVATDQLREVIGELAGMVKPCDAKAKLKGKRSVPQEGAQINYEWEEEESLRFDRDGAFAANVPVKMQVKSSIAECTITTAVDISPGPSPLFRTGRMTGPRASHTL